jgi:hypothetical protein
MRETLELFRGLDSREWLDMGLTFIGGLCIFPVIILLLLAFGD